MAEITWTCTANFTTRSGHSYSATHSYQELVGEKPVKRTRGFCVNKQCKGKPEINGVDGVTYTKKYSTGNKNTFSCPICTYALFFTPRWELEMIGTIENYKYNQRLREQL